MTHAPAQTVAALQAITAPDLSQALVAAHLDRHYGLTGRWRRLGGEREQNFRLQTEDGRDLVVKIAAPNEAVAGLRFQQQALAHLAVTDPALVVPQVIATRTGEAISFLTDDAGAAHPLRVLTFLPGQTLLDRVKTTGEKLDDAALEALGAAAGRMARALRGCPSRLAPSDMPWDLSNGLLFDDSFLQPLPDRIAGLVSTLQPRLRRAALRQRKAS